MFGPLRSQQTRIADPARDPARPHPERFAGANVDLGVADDPVALARTLRAQQALLGVPARAVERRRVQDAVDFDSEASELPRHALAMLAEGDDHQRARGPEAFERSPRGGPHLIE